MSNPTRAEVEQYLQRLDEWPFLLQPPEQRWLCRTVIRALDMRDALEPFTKEVAPAYKMRVAIHHALKKFDGGGDG